PGERVRMRAQLSNLVIYAHRADLVEKVQMAIPGIMALHPARVLLLAARPGPEAGDLTATVCVRSHRLGNNRRIYSEQVTLRAQGRAVERLPFAVRSLLIGDLPINLWWAIPEPPPLGGSLLFDLGERAQQIIYDSIGWTEPARGVVATASWLPQAER